MRPNVTLLPIMTGNGFRRLRLATFILLGFLVAIFFGLRSEHGRRARAFRYHTMKSFEVVPSPEPVLSPRSIPEALWHAEVARRQAPWLR